MFWVLQFEWIMAAFICMIDVLYPIMSFIFMFNRSLQRLVINWPTYWSIWFFIMFQITQMCVNHIILIGPFAEYFNFP